MSRKAGNSTPVLNSNNIAASTTSRPMYRLLIQLPTGEPTALSPYDGSLLDIHTRLVSYGYDTPSYERIRRELKSTGGAFARYLPWSSEGPHLVQIIQLGLLVPKP